MTPLLRIAAAIASADPLEGDLRSATSVTRRPPSTTTPAVETR